MAQPDRGLRGAADDVERARGETRAISFWESREAADKHRVARDQFRDRITSAVGVRVEDVTDYEVMFADLGSVADRIR